MPKLKALRRKSSHKGENGKVLVVGGSAEYPGAAFLAGAAAYRTGADNVTIAAPSKAAWAVNCLSPDLITVKLKGERLKASASKKIIALSKDFDSVLIGNGIGTGKETKKFAAAISEKIRKPKVIDADAIKAVNLRKISDAIITPHRKELEILMKNSRCAQKSLREILGTNVVLAKGRTDRIISAGKTAVNRTGHEGMTVAGTGDVLAGIAAGILAQEKDLWRSAAAAAHVSGKIGEKLSRKHGNGYVASDMLSLIGKEVSKLQ